MADGNDDDALINKILLNRAGNQSKAKSWLAAALPEEAQDDQSQTDKDEDLTEVRGDDDLSGVGAPKSNVEDDDILNRQLLSANDALRRKLLSKEAYGKYQSSRKVRPNTAMAKSAVSKRTADSESEEEGKGRSRNNNQVKRTVEVSDTEANDLQRQGVSATTVPSRGKKRPGSYLDQLLAERGKKKSKAG
ncbi:hypothetical protein LTR64_001141 [Lithohypha guttulata]|uniref:uncharacterized protein n=1 Tax=Lithohypha guttulata TaxID=1690604 RepID=UPI002DE07A43|nr:hypothetical protein LTR51_003335 [Lithohypha guttulata]